MSHLPDDSLAVPRPRSRALPAPREVLRRSVVDVRGLPQPVVPRPTAAPLGSHPTVPAPPATSHDGRGAVLVTGAGGPAGIAVIRRLVALGHRVIAADSDWAAAGGALAHVGTTVPRADHPRFLDALLGIAAAHHVDALIGTVAEELPALTAGFDRLTDAGIATWLPTLESVDLCCDKAAFAERLAEAGVAHPPTTDDVADLGRVPGPWIVKPRWGRGSRGVRLLDAAREVAQALDADPDLILQTRLAGREFTADALVARDGRLLTVVPRWREETKAGISVKGCTFDSEDVTSLVADALAAVQLTGPANVQGFVGEDGAVTIVEINPRFSGGLPLTLAAGADVVAAYLAGIREPDEELPMLWFTPGVRMSRYFAETYTRTDGLPVVDPCAAAVVTA
jgi:carbamoyl-phosphate synthase large subunit